MDKTPKGRTKFLVKLRKSGVRQSPHHSTPESSTSEGTLETASAEQFSPIDSPSRYDSLSQDIQVLWGWKSPEVAQIKTNGVGAKNSFKEDVTPSRMYLSPKPRRKLNCQNYAEKLQSLADELKFLTGSITSSTLPEKLTEEGKLKTTDENSGKDIDKSACGGPIQDAVCGTDKPEAVVEAVKADGGTPQDLFVVELSPGDLTSLKAFPQDHKFPKVPKLDLDTGMNSSDYVVLMEDNSIEDEMMKCTQQVEEELIRRNKKEGKVVSTPDKDSSAVLCVMNTKVVSVKSPRNPRSTSKSPGCPSLSRRSLSLKKDTPSPRRKSVKLNGSLQWDSGCNLSSGKSLGSVVEEDVMGMLADDSFDNIMLEMVVQSEPKKQVDSFHQEKENAYDTAIAGRYAERCLKVEGDPKTDSLGMLEDDSLIQPDVLNFLDTMESQAIAASQPLKCTPEEIKLKKIEAKKKLAVGKRKRRSQMKLNEGHPKVNVTAKSKY